MKSLSLPVKASEQFLSLMLLGCLSLFPVLAQAQSVGWGKDVPLVQCGACQLQVERSFPEDDYSRVVMNREGNGIVIFLRSGGRDTLDGVYTARYSAATNTWLPTVRHAIDTEILQQYAISTPQMGMDVNGNAIAIWQATLADEVRIYSINFDAATGTWTRPAYTAFRGNDASRLEMETRLTVDGKGNAFLVSRNAAVTRYDALSRTWCPPLVLDRGMYGISGAARIAVDEAGNAIVVWQDDSAILASRFRIATGRWSNPRPIGKVQSIPGLTQPRAPDGEPGPVFPHTDVTIAVARTGYAVAQWFILGSGIVVSRYDPYSDIWSRARYIDQAESFFIGAHRIAVDDAGNAFSAWNRLLNSTASHDVYTARFDVGKGDWDEPARLTRSGIYPPDLDVAVAGDGNAVVAYNVFSQELPDPTLHAVRYVAQTRTWQAPIRIQDAEGIGYGAQIAVAPGGSAIAVWIREALFGPDGGGPPDITLTVDHLSAFRE